LNPGPCVYWTDALPTELCLQLCNFTLSWI
jgi:hypothetical protein